ncbi:Txe/YoeB family addiction module toxin [Candidatus Finniella inopinata]|uniref:Putative mRNA interferase YoeB n=1 Tax=Candidatus Finniella inopinata TaxID=1696036 RepID=A0A4Q7DGD4_9PROT|nr:Txe/YoeB family addiction module toxin [Candidatus Finniella inopinata]RZI45863.1 Txe/YoeB family addiction module toxin [Candidatus Finniella inopinata]
MHLEFDENVFDDLRYWVEVDRKKAQKIMALIEEIRRSPFSGTGKPERLKHKLEKSWSRRIDQEHRVVYTVEDKKIRVLSCRYHY